jgi:hypothetical protein
MGKFRLSATDIAAIKLKHDRVLRNLESADRGRTAVTSALISSRRSQLAGEKSRCLLDEVPPRIGVGRDALARAAGVVKIVGCSFVEVDLDIAASMREQLAADARRNFLVGGTNEDTCSLAS